MLKAEDELDEDEVDKNFIPEDEGDGGYFSDYDEDADDDESLDDFIK